MTSYMTDFDNATLDPTAEIKGRSLWQDAMHRLFANKAAVTAMILLSIIAGLSVIGPSVTEFEFDQVDWDSFSQPPTTEHIFGTDANGRDVFVRTLYGGRVSLAIGVIATLVTLIIGVTYGAIAGFVGGKIDELMMRFVDIMYSMPYIIFVVILLSVFGRNIFLLFFAIGAVEWLTMARIVRAQTLALKRKEFIEAAEAGGVGRFTMVYRHIVPNVLGPVVVYATLTIPVVIFAESFLSFLGLGVQEPQTSWGRLIAEGAEEMETAPWLLGFPSIFMAVTLLCLNFIGDGLRDALDPKDR